MSTVDDVLLRAYDVLQDASRVRYPEADLLRYVTDGVRRMRAIRPDLFIGSLTQEVSAYTAGTDPLLVPDRYIEPLALYAAGRAEIRDDEFAVDGRAMALLGTLTATLVQGV